MSEQNRYGYLPHEWAKLTTLEKKIVVLTVGHGLKEHKEVMRWLAWPLEDEPFKEATYKSAWSRLKKKVVKFTQERAKSTLHA